jgi:hypothetical protein
MYLFIFGCAGEWTKALFPAILFLRQGLGTTFAKAILELRILLPLSRQ